MIAAIKKRLRPIKRVSVKMLLSASKMMARSSESLGPPRNFCDNGKEYAKKYAEPGMLPGTEIVSYHPFSAEKTVTIPKLPVTVTNDVHWMFSEAQQYIFPEQYILSLKGGRVVYEHCLIVAPGDCVILDVSREFGTDYKPEKMTIFKKFALPEMQHQQGIIGVVGYTTPANYFHWMVNVLPRIVMLQETGWWNKCDKIVINELKFPYQLETLKALQVPVEKLIFSKHTFHLKAETLIVPSVPQQQDHLPKWTIDFLRKHFLPSSEQKQERKIYLSRRKAGNRRIVNEEELINFLQQRGFECVEMEGLTVREQAQLFNQCAVIVAPHGAGQTNIVFCQEQTVLIELFPAYWSCPIYWSICEQMGLKYYYLMDKNLQAKIDGYKAYKVSDMHVSIPDLSLLLGIAGVE